jgi:hypothetical protein
MWTDALSRRDFFASALGFPALASAAAAVNPLAAKKPPLPATATLKHSTPNLF